MNAIQSESPGAPFTGGTLITTGPDRSDGRIRANPAQTELFGLLERLEKPKHRTLNQLVIFHMFTYISGFEGLKNGSSPAVFSLVFVLIFCRRVLGGHLLGPQNFDR